MKINDGLHNLHSYTHTFTIMKLKWLGWIRDVAPIIQKSGPYKFLGRKTEANRQFICLRRRLDDNIKI
jgi:hypothetical protein